jgi:quinol monooxygenase YgiN
MAKLDLNKLLPYAIGALAGACVAVVLGHVLPCPVPLKRNSKNVYVLAVRLTLVPGTMEAFRARWAVLAANCRSSREPNCLSYELCVKEDDPNTVLIYERYKTKEDLLVTHNSQPAFKDFGNWLAERSGDELLKDGRKSIVVEKSSAWMRTAPTVSPRPPTDHHATPRLPCHTLAFLRGVLLRDQHWAHGALEIEGGRYTKNHLTINHTVSTVDSSKSQGASCSLADAVPVFLGLEGSARARSGPLPTSSSLSASLPLSARRPRRPRTALREAREAAAGESSLLASLLLPLLLLPPPTDTASCCFRRCCCRSLSCPSAPPPMPLPLPLSSALSATLRSPARARCSSTRRR